MSRIGRKPITVPSGVDVTLNNTVITVKGPKGTLTRELHKDMSVTVENNEINVVRPRTTNFTALCMEQPAALSITW